MLLFFSLFFVLVVPGLLATYVYENVGLRRTQNFWATALIFDLFIFIINITGLYFFHDIYTIEGLQNAFNCLSFTRNYALLSILVGIILAIIFGLAFFFVPFRNRAKKD